MTQLVDIKKDLQHNLKAECSLLNGIESLRDSSIANWLDAQSMIIKGFKWEDSVDGKSSKITGTSTLFDLAVDIIANFLQDDDCLVFDLSISPPKDTKLTIPGLPKGPDVEDLALVLTSRMGEVESGFGDPIFFDTFTAAFDATIRLTGDLTIPIVLRLPVGDATDWTLQGNFEKLTLSSGLSGLASMAGGDPNWMSALPPQIQELGGFAFHDVGVTFNPTAGTVSLVSLVISSDKLDIIPGTLSIEEPRIGIDIYNVTDSAQRDVRGNFSGTIQIGGESGVDIFLSAEVPAMRFRGALADGTTLNFTSLLGHLLPGVTLPKDAPDFVLHDLNVYVDATQKSFSIYARCFSDWEVIPKVVLSTVQVDLNYSGSMECNLLGVFNIGGVDVSLSAAHPGGDTGWQFEGSTGAGEKIPIVSLIAEFVDATDLPESLKTLDIENLSVSFNTQSRDFKFTGEVEFKFEKDNPNSTALDMVLTIELKNQNGSYSKHFSGVITLDKGTATEMDFAVIFDSKTDVNDPTKNVTGFLAAYNNPKGVVQPIKPLVKSISPSIADPIPESLSFTIKDALLAYLETNENKKPASKFLFGIDIDGGMNLSDLHLEGLPFVGSIFPPDQTLKLSFKLLATILPKNTSFSLDNVSYVNGLLAGGPQLPNKAIDAELDLATILQIGSESKTLDLQVGVNKQGDAAKSGDQNTGLPAKQQDTAGGTQPTPTSGNTNIVTSSTPSAANAQSADGMQWIVVQKSFGPVSFERVGLAYKEGNITGALDASLMAGGLTIALNGLSVSSPLTKFDPQFDLHGLGIDYKNGGLEIGGAFLKQQMTQDGTTYTSFGGMAIIRTEKLTISAIGSYANYRDHPSMFIYAMLDYPIGGPSFFFVTGLAAGFGYNRDLNIPTIDTLNQFPLIADALQGAGAQQSKKIDLAAKLASLENYIPPTVGEHFLAIGIKFTTFEIVESFALLTVKFGGKLEFDLLGLSTLVSPPPEEGKSIPPVAKATLALKATFIPDDGIFSLQAQLTSDSFILSQACHLTGGFAFFSWFKDNGNIKAGDFVLTLGGYHPKYQVPAHYPKVPALGISWQVSDELSIKGDAYFALTPQALMAGGHLEALWHSGDLSAWFKAGADFLISWKPYHYDAALYIDIGASYTFELFGRHTISVDLGADLHLWGPEFAGTAELHIYIFSLTVEFGDQGAQKPLPIDWDHFKASFLPADDQVCTIAVQSGLVRQIKENETDTRWIVNPKELVFATNSVVPISSELSIAPMGRKKNVTSQQIITIKRGDDDVTSTDFDCSSSILKSVPAALWDDPVMDGKFLKPPDMDPDKALVPGAEMGYAIKPVRLPTADSTKLMDREMFSYEITLSNSYMFAGAMDPIAAVLKGNDAWNQADQDNRDLNITAKRENFLNSLGFSSRLLDYGESMNQDLILARVQA